MKTAKENNVLLMEAMKSTMLPSYKIVKKNLYKIWKVRKFLGNFCRYSSAYDAHKQVGEYAKSKGIDLLITLGEFNDAYKEGFNDIDKYRSFETYNEVVSFLDKFINQDDVVLVKASRYMKFESIVSALAGINPGKGLESGENFNNKEVIDKWV